MTRSRRRRGALQTAELLIVLPVLGLIGMGLFQYGIFFVQQNRLQSAVDAACRVAAQEKDHYARQHKSEAMFYEVLGEVTWKQECQLDISLRDVSRFAGFAGLGWTGNQKRRSHAGKSPHAVFIGGIISLAKGTAGWCRIVAWRRVKEDAFQALAE
jgi:type II secretory pathway pseudopilin PulG